MLVALIRRSDPARFAPLLRLLGLPGLQPYAPVATPATSQRPTQGALLSLGLFALLVGMNALNASKQFLLLSALIIGTSYAGLRGFLLARQMRRTILTAQLQTTEDLTPSENALGLTGLLVATGADYATARQQTESMLAAPDHVDTAQLSALGMLHPGRYGDMRAALQHATYFALGGIAVIWPCWVTHHPVQLLVGSLGYALTCFVLHGTSPRLKALCGRGGLIGAGSFGVGLLFRHGLHL